MIYFRLDTEEDWQIINDAPKPENGVFETLHFRDGDILLWDLHFKRLIHGLAKCGIGLPFDIHTLKFKLIELLEGLDLETAKIKAIFYNKNNSKIFDVEDTRIKVGVSNLPFPSFIENTEQLNLGIYQKVFLNENSVIKSNNRKIYLEAYQFAQENKYDDVVLLDSNKNVCETTISNIFFVINDKIFTPKLERYGLKGVMRQHVITILKEKNYSLIEDDFKINDLKLAEEIFLTNVIRGIRKVKSFEGKELESRVAVQLQNEI